MEPFGHDARFWITVALAVVVKVAISGSMSLLRIFITAASAIFVASVFTDPVLHWLELPPDVYDASVAALLALISEWAVRWLISASPEKILKLWRGPDAGGQ